MKEKIATIHQLQAISCKDCGEVLVGLEHSDARIISDYRRKDSGIQSILVRETVFHKLLHVQRKLPLHMNLLVVEGFRRYAYQEDYFLKEMWAQNKSNPSMDFDLLLEHTHQFVALPSVSGHPTGGAVDVTIVYQSKEVDMGGNIADFSSSQLLPTYSPFITPEQAKWRKILHDAMVVEGFAPFYGEWWHYSYGDREWAAFYHQLQAIYAPIFD